MPQVHKFSTPSAFCGAVNGHTFASKDPKAMKIFMNIAMGSRPPGFHHHAIEEEECEPDLPVCDITSLPIIPVNYDFHMGDCVNDLVADFESRNIYAQVLDSYTTGGVYAAFTKLIELVAAVSVFNLTDCDYNFVIIFDGKVAVPWGHLVPVTPTTAMLSPRHFYFPPTFSSFEFVYYTGGVYYGFYTPFKFPLP